MTITYHGSSLKMFGISIKQEVTKLTYIDNLKNLETLQK